VRLAAHDDAPAAGGIRVLDALGAHHDAAGREIRPFDELHELVHRNVLGVLGVVDQICDAVGDLGQVVRRDIGRHAHRDARRAVNQQVRQQRGHHRRLLEGAVEVVAEIDRFLVEIGQHVARDAGEARFGIAHRRRAVAVERAEVALPVDQRVAHGEVLRQAYQRVVHGHVAVRVVLAEHLADDARAFFVRRVVADAELVHGEQHAAVHRLEAVAHVGQSARHDHAHRVVEVGGLHFDLDVALPHDADVLLEGGFGQAGRVFAGFFAHGHLTGARCKIAGAPL
jgi:hypothetical protein